MKKVLSLLICLCMLVSIGACGKKETEADVNVGVLNGPTGMGAIGFMSKSDADEIKGYQFSIITDPSDMVAKLCNGELQIGALPTNLAANLYNKTNGQVKIIALNTLGVLYMLQNGNEVTSYDDLKGKTIYSAGQGSNPEYILKYILESNGIDPENDVKIIFAEATDICSKMISGEAEICMLPVPAATALQMKSDKVRVLFDMTEEYDKCAGGAGTLSMGCIVARTEFIDKNSKRITEFLNYYKQSIDDVKNNPDSYADAAVSYGLTASDEIAKKAIPQCNMVYIAGADIKPALEGYLELLFSANPASIGGSLPADDFYYEGK